MHKKTDAQKNWFKTSITISAPKNLNKQYTDDYVFIYI